MNLPEAIELVGELHDSCGKSGALPKLHEYTNWEEGWATIQLDGVFTADQLEAIAIQIRHRTKHHEQNQTP